MPRRLGYRLASAVGDLTFLAWTQGRRNAIANMQRVLGPGGNSAEARRLARQAMRNYCKTLADFICLPRFTGEDIEQLVQCDKWHLFDRALAEGHGVVFVTMHMGSWDMGGALLGRRPYHFSVLADVVGASALNRKVLRTREEKGFKIITAGRVPKAAIAALRKNHVLGVVMDRPVAAGVTVRFFGAPATFPAGVAAIALRTGAPVLPGCILRQPDDTYAGIVDEPIFPQPTGDFQQDVSRLTQMVVDRMESFIRIDPGQWYAFRPIWTQAAVAATNQAGREALAEQC